MKGKYRVGDRVSLSWGFTPMEGTITEDHGPLGVGGRRLYQVEVPMDPFEPMIAELAEDEMSPFDPANGHNTPIKKSDIIQYLKNGGLALILRSNKDGGPKQPRVWLRHDSHGNITFTFAEERGKVGGERVPEKALYHSQVFTPKRDEVVQYLRSFGLSKAEAEEVVAEVGTAPRAGAHKHE
jgi:hypothetical protein